MLSQEKAPKSELDETVRQLRELRQHPLDPNRTNTVFLTSPEAFQEAKRLFQINQNPILLPEHRPNGTFLIRHSTCYPDTFLEKEFGPDDRLQLLYLIRFGTARIPQLTEESSAK